ncbi:MAG: hypothetical protein D6730_10840 [Bacteroidetes bacterium]|nr:MAG: hypothetical protein D6730_10840 [Bacteroidota bacterium]
MNKQLAVFLLTPLLSFATLYAQELPPADSTAHTTRLFAFEELGFSIEIPAHWYVVQDTANRQLMEQVRQLMTGGEEELLGQFGQMEKRETYLLTAFEQNPRKLHQAYNASIAITTEDLSDLPEITDAQVYLARSMQTLQQSKLDYRISGPVKVYMYSGQHLYARKVHLHYGGSQIKQVYYTTFIGRKALNVVISYLSEAQRHSLETVLRSLVFR